MQSTTLLRQLYLQILEQNDSTATRQFIFNKCVEHQEPVLTYFNRIISSKIESKQKTVLSNIKAVLIKPINDTCNLACDYCYQGAGSERSKGTGMSNKDLEKITKELLSSPRRDIQFLWHGGEPLLAGINFYRTAFELQKKYNIHECSIWNGFQTNGLLLNDEWLEFIKDYKFGVSISFDGLESIHNKHRITHQGEGTYNQLLRAFNLLRNADIPFNVITVINNELVPHAIDFWQLINELGIKNIDIHPSCNIGISKSDFLHPVLFSDFIKTIFDLWVSRRDISIKVSVIEEFFRVLTGNPIKTCYHAGVCSDIIAVEGNGNVIPCTRPFDKSKFIFGNINSSNLTEIVEGHTFSDFKSQDFNSQQLSRECKWFEICHNGCPQHRLSNGRQDISSGSVYCQCTSGIEGGNYAIWDYMYDRISQIWEEK